MPLFKKLSNRSFLIFAQDASDWKKAIFQCLHSIPYSVAFRYKTFKENIIYSLLTYLAPFAFIQKYVLDIKICACHSSVSCFRATFFQCSTCISVSENWRIITSAPKRIIYRISSGEKHSRHFLEEMITTLNKIAY